MQFLTLPNKVNPPEFNAVLSTELRHVTAISKKEPKHLDRFELNLRLISLEGGRQLLRLLKPLKLLMKTNKRFEVLDWGIEMDCTELPNLPRELARRFLFLLNNAEQEKLLERDQADWVRISDYIDFRQFSIDRSPPRYMEGLLVTRKHKTLVEWHDGKSENISSNAARALHEVDVGERFSAHVKLGKDDEVVFIERISLLDPASASEGEDLAT